MIRNIKALGLALAAVLALSVVGASAAQAEGMHFTGTKGATISGGQLTEHVFTVQGSKVTCKEATFTGEIAAEKSSEQKVGASYKNCTAFGFINATVNMNSCHYLFTVEKTDASDLGNKDRGEGSVHVTCNTAGDSITVVAGPCTVHIGPQTVGGITYEATTGKGTMDVKVNASGIKSDVTSGFLCPLTSKTGDTSGTYVGTTEMTPSSGSLGLEMT